MNFQDMGNWAYGVDTANLLKVESAPDSGQDLVASELNGIDFDSFSWSSFLMPNDNEKPPQDTPLESTPKVTSADEIKGCLSLYLVDNN